MNCKPILALLALATCSCMVVGDWGKVEYADFKSSEPSQGEERIEARIELGVGQLRVEPGSASETYELELRYNEAAFKPDLDFRRQGATAVLNFNLEGKGRSGKAGHNELNLRLNPEARLAFQGKTGVGENDIDFSGMKVESISLAAGVGKTTLSMLSPNPIRCKRVKLQTGVGSFEARGLGNLNFEELRFDGGVGGAELDFSGAWEHSGDISIAVGVGGVEVYLPREVGFELRASKSFLSSLSIPGFTKQGSIYRSDNYDKAQKHATIRIKAGIGGIDVRWK
ncbi:MAG: LiaF domain-containing protein [Acidobacteriota bacterium]